MANAIIDFFIKFEKFSTFKPKGFEKIFLFLQLATLAFSKENIKKF